MPLSPAEAIKRLDEARNIQATEDWYEKTLFETLGAKPNRWGYHDSSSVMEAYHRLNFLNRGKAMGILGGKMRHSMELALKNAATMPIQTGFDRLPFRSPNNGSALDYNIWRILRTTVLTRNYFDQPIEWHAAFIGYWEKENFTHLDLLLGAEIDAGNKPVLEILIQSLQGTHPIGIPSITGIRALLRSNSPDAWLAVEKSILGALRNEGLRQAIIECCDELNPRAFVRVVRLIIEHGLLRFSSVIRSFAMWFPGLIDEKQPKSGEAILSRVLDFLSDSSLQPEPTYNDTYLRLWADAFRNTDDANARALLLMKSPEVVVRQAVGQIAISMVLQTSKTLISALLSDRDLRVVGYGVACARNLVVKDLYHQTWGPNVKDQDWFNQTVAPRIFEIAMAWPQQDSTELLLSRKEIWGLALDISDKSQYEFFFKNLSELGSDDRATFARRLSWAPNAQKRKQIALQLTADHTSYVRSVAFKELEIVPLEPGDAEDLEVLLKRKASDLRKSVLSCLAQQKDFAAVESAKRLVASKDANQVSAGQELFAVLAKRGVQEAQIVSFANGAVTEIKGDASDLFGLIDVSSLTYPDRPVHIPNLQIFTPGAIELIKDLDSYIEQNRDEKFCPTYYYRDEELTLGNLVAQHLALPRQSYHIETVESCLEKNEFLVNLIQWYGKIKATRYPDGLDLTRSLIMLSKMSITSNDIPGDLRRVLSSHFNPLPKYLSGVKVILEWIADAHGQNNLMLLATINNLIASSARDDYISGVAYHRPEVSWRAEPHLEALIEAFVELTMFHSSRLTAEEWRRGFTLLRFFDEPAGRSKRDDVEKLWQSLKRTLPIQYLLDSNGEPPAVKSNIPNRIPIEAHIVDNARQSKACTPSDVMDQARLDLKKAIAYSTSGSQEYQSLVQKVVARIVEVEVTRGELPGPASELASQVTGYIGLPQVMQIMASGVPLARYDYYVDEFSRAQSFTKLLAFSKSRAGETPEIIANEFKKLKIKQDRWIEFAMLNPLWAEAIEIVLGWEGFASAVWWLHAHTKDTSWSVPQEIKNNLAGAVSERTSLTPEQLENGSCDPQWYFRVREVIDDKQWKLLDKNAKFASYGVGHTRAQLFAKALSGAITAKEIADNILTKRNPNYVRAFGLVPLSEPEKEIRERYLVLQEFLVGSRQFGSMKQQTEKLAYGVALENLAFTAGYPDALRLTWALEASEVQDLKGDGLVVTSGELEVRLKYDVLGLPEITATKAGKPLKEIPSAEKKKPEIKALTERRTQLKKQLSRMRIALEQAMQRGDRFKADELKNLMDHPGLRLLLRNLVFIGESGIADFPDEAGSVAGETGELHIAHAYDLLNRGDWAEWQSRIFLEERIQPFKQVFRELYVLTEAEKTQNSVTRYGGHQINPSKAIAILGKRGWIARYEEGVSKTFHSLGITAWLTDDFVGFTPGDIEGVTLESLIFTKSGSYTPLPLSEIPPLVFSETMRDLDLIVSVANMTGYDPESSESTLEMRQKVIEQTSKLLRLNNVSFIPRHVIIEGNLARYSVNLSSATVHQEARGELVIVAVRQPQRGRIFLPFVDDDPRTAEIVSKVILLARDDEIKDPTIITQIVRVS